jgi:hypothetical protein
VHPIIILFRIARLYSNAKIIRADLCYDGADEGVID